MNEWQKFYKHIEHCWIRGIFALIFLILAFESHAGTFSGSFAVLASVNNNCAIAAGDFIGTYDPFNPTAFTGSQNFVVQCTLGTVYNVRLNPGLHGPDVNHRALSDGTHLLTYTAYRDSGHTLHWGQTDGVDTLDSTGTGVTQTFAVYGLIPAGQVVPPGTYTDTLTLTVNF